MFLEITNLSASIGGIGCIILFFCGLIALQRLSFLARDKSKHITQKPLKLKDYIEYEAYIRYMRETNNLRYLRCNTDLYYVNLRPIEFEFTVADWFREWEDEYEIRLERARKVQTEKLKLEGIYAHEASLTNARYSGDYTKLSDEDIKYYMNCQDAEFLYRVAEIFLNYKDDYREALKRASNAAKEIKSYTKTKYRKETATKNDGFDSVHNDNSIEPIELSLDPSN